MARALVFRIQGWNREQDHIEVVVQGRQGLTEDDIRRNELNANELGWWIVDRLPPTEARIVVKLIQEKAGRHSVTATSQGKVSPGR